MKIISKTGFVFITVSIFTVFIPSQVLASYFESSFESDGWSAHSPYTGSLSSSYSIGIGGSGSYDDPTNYSPKFEIMSSLRQKKLFCWQKEDVNLSNIYNYDIGKFPKISIGNSVLNNQEMFPDYSTRPFGRVAPISHIFPDVEKAFGVSQLCQSSSININSFLTTSLNLSNF